MEFRYSQRDVKCQTGCSLEMLCSCDEILIFNYFETENQENYSKTTNTYRLFDSAVLNYRVKHIHEEKWFRSKAI